MDLQYLQYLKWRLGEKHCKFSFFVRTSMCAKKQLWGKNPCNQTRVVCCCRIPSTLFHALWHHIHKHHSSRSSQFYRISAATFFSWLWQCECLASPFLCEPIKTKPAVMQCWQLQQKPGVQCADCRTNQIFGWWIQASGVKACTVFIHFYYVCGHRDCVCSLKCAYEVVKVSYPPVTRVQVPFSSCSFLCKNT